MLREKQKKTNRRKMLKIIINMASIKINLLIRISTSKLSKIGRRRIM